MQFIYSFIQIAVSIINVRISLWFIDNIIVNTKKINYYKRYIFIILILVHVLITERRGLLELISGYYILLFIYHIYNRAEIDVLKIFLMTRLVSSYLTALCATYIFISILDRNICLEVYYDNIFLRQAIYALTVSCRIFVLRRNMEGEKIILNLNKKQMLISSAIFIIIQYFLIIIIEAGNDSNRVITNYEVFLMVLLFCVNTLFYKILMLLSKTTEEKYFLEMNIKQTELEERYIEEISQIYKDIREWKHDYRNNINVICNLAIADKQDELFKYIEEMDEEIKISEAVIYTGVFLIDSVITSKYLYGNSKGIKFNIKTERLDKGNISVLDLNIILSNLLDNAIEGACRAKEKIISISIYEKNNNMVFVIKNTYDGNFRKVDDVYATLKEGSMHGLGRKRVINAIERNNGFIYTNDENYIFVNKVIIPITNG